MAGINKVVQGYR